MRDPLQRDANGEIKPIDLRPSTDASQVHLVDMKEDPNVYTIGALAVRVVRLRQSLRGAGFEGDTIRAVRSEGYQPCVPTCVE